MATKTFPLVRGRKMRVTRLDSCGRPVYGPNSQVVSDGFISVALTANVQEGEQITIVNAAGNTTVDDRPEAELMGYASEITLTAVNPDIVTMISGQSPVLAGTDVVGFRMNKDVDASTFGFALEVWAGVPGDTCAPGSVSEPSGYILLPFNKGGILGDFTVENAAVNAVITGANTKSGSDGAPARTRLLGPPRLRPTWRPRSCPVTTFTFSTLRLPLRRTPTAPSLFWTPRTRP